MSIREQMGVKSAAQQVRYFNVMLYGDPGVGKTLLASTAQDHPDLAPVLILDTEGGTATIRDRYDIDVLEVKSIKAMNEAFEHLRKDAANGEQYYRTVALDSLTEFQKVDLADVMVDAVAKNSREDKDVASQRSWGITINHTRALVRGFRDLPYNVIFTALAKTDQDSDNTIITSPNLPGKLAGEIPGFLDVLGYMYVEINKGVSERRLQVQPTRRVKAKDRLGVSQGKGVVINPTIPMLWNNMLNVTDDKELDNDSA